MSVAAPTTRSADATIPSTTLLTSSSPYLCWRISISHTPAIAIGTLPTASHRAIPRWTVLCLRWRQAPAVLVTAP